MVIKRTLAAIGCAIALTGCGVVATQKVSGEIKAVECARALLDTYITLDNGAVYRHPSSSYCNISVGTNITIYHDDNLNIERIVVEGAEEVTQ